MKTVIDLVTTAELQDVINRVAALESTLTNISNSIASTSALQASITNLSAQIATLTSRIGSNETGATSMAQQLAALSPRLTALAARVTVLEAGGPPAPAPAPVLASITPASFTADNANHSMILTGQNFVAGNTLTFSLPSGASMPSDATKLTVVSSTQINYQFNSASANGQWHVIVNSPDGTLHSTPVAFSVTVPVTAPAPVLNSVSPATYPADSTNHTMQLLGQNFAADNTLTFTSASGATIQSSSANLTFISAGELDYQFSAGTVSGSWQVRVNSGDGTQHSAFLQFTVQAVAPPPPVGTAFVTTSIANITSSPMPAGAVVQFPHGIAQGDLTDGNILSVTDDLGGAVTYTAARRANWPLAPTNRSFVDLFCLMANGIPAKIAITSLTISGTTATCTTASPHGLATGAKVLIKHVNTDASINANSSYYAGLVSIVVTSASTFTYTVPGLAPSLPATQAMEMCYTRQLSLAAVAGTWNDALPAGKTSANILTDLQANFSNISLELLTLKNNVGAAVGSGTYTADFFTCIAQAGTDQLRVTATGPTLCDFTGIMHFADASGGARHATLTGWFYVSAILNPTTGAVVEVQARAFIGQSQMNAAMSYYTFQSRMKLGTTVVRSMGLSNDATVDGKMQNIDPTAVNMTTKALHLPGHGFSGGERVQFSTTGTLPAPLTAGRDYAVVWLDPDNIQIDTVFYNFNQSGGSYSGVVAFTTQGSGTHTITCWQQCPYGTHMAYVAKDGKVDRWTGNSGALAPIAHHVIHDCNYLQLAKLIPAIDLRINLSNPAADSSVAASGTNSIKSRSVFGTVGILQYDQASGGGGTAHEYGAPWTDVPGRRSRQPNDIGYCQTLRTSALSMGAWDIFLTNDDVTWRPPVVNNGPNRAGATYTGMPPSKPNGWWFSGSRATGFTFATDYTCNPGIGPVSIDHAYMLTHPAYMFEGRQEFHDMMVADGMRPMALREPSTFTTPGDNALVRCYSISGVPYYTGAPFLQQRSDAWYITMLCWMATLVAANAPERAVLKDYIDDTLTVIDYFINTLGKTRDPTWQNIGTWVPGNVMPFGPGVAVNAGNDYLSTLFEYYLSMATAASYRIYPSAKFQLIAGHFSRFTDKIGGGVGGANTAAFVNSNDFRIKQASSLGPNAGLTIQDFTVPMVFDQNYDGIAYLPDGRVFTLYQGGYTGSTWAPVNGDKHSLNTNISTNAESGFFLTAPPELSMFSTYYVRQANGTYQGFKYATSNSDAAIIPSYSVLSTSTVAAAIGTGTTTVTTGSVLTGFNVNYPVVIISSAAGIEICLVSAGRGTATLTLARGYYTPTLNHGTGATIFVPYLTNAWVDLQNRTVPPPPAAHGWGVPGTSNLPIFGYRTMHRAAAGAWFVNGIIPRTAFDNSSLFFDDALTNGPGGGPTSFGLTNQIKHSVNVTLAR